MTEQQVITAEQVTPFTKNRVIEILNIGLSPITLRVASTGLAFEGFKTANPSLTVETSEERFQNRQAITEYISANRAHYVKLALGFYTESVVNELVDSAFGTSSPDGTGNSLDLEAAADNVIPGATTGAPGATAQGEVCPFCNEVHEPC